MAPREDLVSSAVNFLQDPSVAASPVEKRIEFLKSKNLTQDEIDLALSQATSDPSQLPASQSPPYYPAQQYQRPPPRGNYAYQPYGEWQPPPPPELPRRDWRDWFIMATVVGGAGYGLYVLADRYVKPLVAPPTPPQLEQDKAAIDEQFNKAFALLDTLSSDTSALKEAEQARTQRLDSAIVDVEGIVAELRAANTKREDDARRMESEIKGLKDSLPRAIDGVRDASEKQLKELSNELASLKLLMANRVGGSSGSTAPFGSTHTRAQMPAATSVRSGTGTPTSEVAPASSSNATAVNGSFGFSGAAQTPSYTAPTAVPASSSTPRPQPMTSFGTAANKPAIPAWQMAASKSKDFNIAPTPSAHVNGTSSAPADGADAVAALGAS